MTKDVVTLASQQRFSSTELWQMQRDFFDDEGIDAWSKQVPFYVTSNPYIAHAYASLMIGFIRDRLDKHPELIAEPFYFVELGTGPGMFSYYVLKSIRNLQQELSLQSIKFVYVMTDFTRANLDFWCAHPALNEFVEQGCLDFSLFDLECSDALHLEVANTDVEAGSLLNPLVVLANYIFDSVSHDAFSVEQGVIEESLLTLTSSSENVDDAGKVIDWESVSLEYTSKPCDLATYYEDKDLAAVLQSYQGRLHNTHLLIPVAGLMAIKRLSRLSQQGLLLISSDKAQTAIDELDNLKNTALTTHGSFSLMVNYDAFYQFSRSCGGDGIMQTARNGLRTNVFSLGFGLDDCPNLKTAAQRYIQECSPADYFMYHRHISDNFNDLDAPILAAQMGMSRWDPHMFHRLSPRINELISDADSATQDFMRHGMARVADNFYDMPVIADVFFDIAIFFHTLYEYSDALHYYERSEQRFGVNFNLLFNKALCFHYLGDDNASLDLFKQALSVDADSEQAKQWIDQLSDQSTGLSD